MIQAQVVTGPDGTVVKIPKALLEAAQRAETLAKEVDSLKKTLTPAEWGLSIAEKKLIIEERQSEALLALLTKGSEVLGKGHQEFQKRLEELAAHHVSFQGVHQQLEVVFSELRARVAEFTASLQTTEQESVATAVRELQRTAELAFSTPLAQIQDSVTRVLNFQETRVAMLEAQIQSSMERWQASLQTLEKIMLAPKRVTSEPERDSRGKILRVTSRVFVETP